MGKAPGVYVYDTPSPARVVPDVSISRLMILGDLPWIADKEQWSCSSWRDIEGSMRALFRKHPGLTDELMAGLEWDAGKAVAAGVVKSLTAAADSLKLTEGDTKKAKDSSPALVAQRAEENARVASTNGLKDRGGDIALTLWSAKLFFEHGGDSLVVYRAKPQEVTVKKLRDLDIGLVCNPGGSWADTRTLAGFCGSRDNEPEGDSFCFALGDTVRSHKTDDLPAAGSAVQDYSVAVFGPWLKRTIKTKDGNVVVQVPASPAVAGLIAACDAKYGPARAAAGTEFAVRGDVELTWIATDSEHGDLNDKGINMLRAFAAGQSPVVFGARTLSDQVMYRYVPVVRTQLALRKALKQSLKSFVFEPNDQGLRERVYLMLYTYLEGRRRRGWLKGASAEEAFRITFPTTVEDEAKGILRVRVEVAIARPAEFIEVEVTEVLQVAA